MPAAVPPYRRAEPLSGCHCCGLIQTVPPSQPQRYPVCARCATPLQHANPGRNRLTAALACAALTLYPPAMLLPVMRLERLGHVSEASLIDGVRALLAQGHWLIGVVILLFSVLLPPLKLAVLAALTWPGLIGRHEHRAWLYRWVERVGRWGMLDVLLVAVLVAFVKLGDLVNVAPGRGALAFTLMVLLSLCASLAFNPVLMWQQGAGHGEDADGR